MLFVASMSGLLILLLPETLRDRQVSLKRRNLLTMRIEMILEETHIHHLI